MQGRAQLRSVARRASAQERSSTTFRRRRPCSSRYSSSPHTRLASSSMSVRTPQIPWRAPGRTGTTNRRVLKTRVPNVGGAARLRWVEQRTREGLTGWVSQAQQVGVVGTDLSAERMASWIMPSLKGLADLIGGAGDFGAEVERALLREGLVGLLT